MYELTNAFVTLLMHGMMILAATWWLITFNLDGNYD
jgi:hypothetical protein